MAEVSFKSLQNLHESLLQKQQTVLEENQQDFASEVRDYIEHAKRAGSNIASTRERDQIRANLRYWANYIYAIDKTFPDTELAPSTATGGGSFWATSFGKLSSLVLGIVVLVSIGTLLFRREAPPEINETSTAVLPTAMIQTTSMPEPTAEIENTPTPLFVGSDVVLTSPENGESVTPKVVFKGAYTKLEAGASIHVFLIRSDRLYPIRDSFTVSEDAPNGDWEIPVALYLKPEELEKAENLAVVPATCFDNPCRETLVNAAESGLAIDELPSQFSFTLYRNSSRVVYRNAYHAVQESRLVYSYFDGNSYDLYTARPDGSDVIRITNTQEYSEMFPNLSPDGTKIVYIKRFKNTSSDPFMYAIGIMDSNGQNIQEISNISRNALESPQWSPDSSYISFTMIETRESSSTPYSSIHSYQLKTKEDISVSGEPAAFINRYSSWIPNKNIIVFDAGISDITRFVQTPADSQQYSVYFDPGQYVSQPNISTLGTGYLLTYTVIDTDANFVHDIYAVIDTDAQPPFDGRPTQLIRSGGEVVDYPQADTSSNILYYTRNGAILRVEYVVDGSQIRKTSSNPNGELVVPANPTREAIHFDINFMDAFFPIP